MDWLTRTFEVQAMNALHQQGFDSEAVIVLVNFLIITAFTIWVFKALRTQARVIKESNSGESISITWNIYWPADYFAFLVYGYYSGLLSAMPLVLCGVGHLLILHALWRADDVSFNLAHRALMFVIPALPFSVWLVANDTVQLFGDEVYLRQIIFLCSACVVIASLSSQPMELRRSGRRGKLTWRLVAVYLLDTAAWVGLALLQGDGALLFFGGGAFAIMVWLAYEWKRARP